MNRQEFIEKITQDLTEYDKLSLKLDDKIEITMVNTILKDGSTLWTDAETFDVGCEVYFMEGTDKKAVDDGTYPLEDDSKYVIAGSKITSIEPAVAAVAEETKTADATVNQAEVYYEIKDLVPMLIQINEKLDKILGTSATDVTEPTTDSTMMSKLEALEIQMEKLLVDKENKKTETIEVKQSTDVKPGRVSLSYEETVALGKKLNGYI